MFLALSLVLCACGSASDASGGSTPAQPSIEDVVGRLEIALDLLAEQRVSVIMNRSNCRLIDYADGSFTAHVADWCVALAGGRPGAFTDDASADFDGLVAALDVGRAAFADASVEGHSPSGEITGATFRYTYGFGSELLVFDPGYALPTNVPGERWYETIDDAWYLVTVDWN